MNLKISKTVFVTIIAISLSPGSALAFNFGFVRVPDWMDIYVIGLIALLIPFLALTMLTKPEGVPFGQLYKTKMASLPTFAFRAVQLIFVSMMALVFIGMGLARM